MIRRASVSFVLLLWSSNAWCGSWSLGTHLGVGVIESDQRGSGSSTVLAWQSSAFTYQPSLRIAVGNIQHADEAFFDSGLFLVNEAGSILSLFIGSIGYQHTFGASRRNAPYANVDLGVFREGGASRASVATTYGAGVGVRHVVGERHGALRAEVRVDHLLPDQRIGRPGLNTFGLRLGFDLWP